MGIVVAAIFRSMFLLWSVTSGTVSPRLFLPCSISEILRNPHYLDSWLIDGGKVVSPTHQPHFAPQKHFFFLMFPVLISVRG
jgi:hypothetical protein